MAADPCAEDWNERLVIDYGEGVKPEDDVPGSSDAVLPALPTAGKAPPGKLFATPGDQRQLF